MKRLEIEWIDAVVDKGGWVDSGDVESYELTRCKTLGYFMSIDQEKIILVQSVGIGNDGELYNSPIVIPIVNVIFMRELFEDSIVLDISDKHIEGVDD